MNTQNVWMVQPTRSVDVITQIKRLQFLSYINEDLLIFFFMTFQCKGANAHILRFPLWSLIICFPSIRALEITLPVLCWHRLTRQKHSISGYKGSLPACSAGQTKHQLFLKPFCILYSTSSAYS